jgi:hypothetical protein
MRKLTAILLIALLAVPFSAFALTDAEVETEIGNLNQRVDELSKDNEKLTKRLKASRSPITISGDYQFRMDSIEGDVPLYYQFNPAAMMTPDAAGGYTAKNSDLWTNRFGLNIHARATEDITFKARLVMYKVWGHQSADTVLGPYFADRYSMFDGNTSHVPQDSVVRVDTAFASWSGIGDSPVWFSVGRRPSTGGIPTNLRHNLEKSGASGTPGILVDYAFDGLVLGIAPDIDALPGAYAKLCYGKGFDSGFQPDGSSLKDVKMIGLDVAAYETEALRIEFQYNRALDIFAQPETSAADGNMNLGNIDQFGAVVTGKAGNINWFASAAMSKTDPNDNLYLGLAGLLYDNPMMGGEKKSKTGNAVYVGARYDLDDLGLKFGAEYNQGSEDWITFTPAADDMLTSKLGVRGNVTEFYVIKDLKQKPVSRRGRAFFKLGYQDYTFDYTGSNNWVGAPKDMDDINNPMLAQMLVPIEAASNMYFTYNVEF